MWVNLQHRRWYWAIAALSIVVFLVALGGGLFGQGGFWMEHWQHKLFNGLCHQDPQRSFSLNGSPMAVCSRCLGIYSSFSVAWMLFPLASTRVFKVRSSAKYFLTAAILINLIDIAGNILGFWQNTLLSRYALGIMLGCSAVLILGYEFINNQHQKTG